MGNIEDRGSNGAAAHRQRRRQARFRVLEFEIVAGHPRGPWFPTTAERGGQRRNAFSSAGRKRQRRKSASAWGAGALAGSGDAGVFLAELVHATGGVHHLLLAGIKRMTVRTDVEAQIVADGRARLEGVAAAAGHRDFLVVRMGRGFHGIHFLMDVLRTRRALCKAGVEKRARSLALSPAAPQALFERGAQAPDRRRRWQRDYPQFLWITLCVSASQRYCRSANSA